MSYLYGFKCNQLIHVIQEEQNRKRKLWQCPWEVLSMLSVSWMEQQRAIRQAYAANGPAYNHAYVCVFEASCR